MGFLHIPNSLPGALQRLGPGEDRRRCHLRFHKPPESSRPGRSAGTVRYVERGQAHASCPWLPTPLNKQAGCTLHPRFLGADNTFPDQRSTGRGLLLKSGVGERAWAALTTPHLTEEAPEAWRIRRRLKGRHGLWAPLSQAGGPGSLCLSTYLLRFGDLHIPPRLPQGLSTTGPEAWGWGPWGSRTSKCLLRVSQAPITHCSCKSDSSFAVCSH